MVEVDAKTPLIGADGPVPLIDVFGGRSQLIAYYQMWHTGKPAAERCVRLHLLDVHINQLSYLHSRDVRLRDLLPRTLGGELALPRLHGLDRRPGSRCRRSPPTGCSRAGTSASWPPISAPTTGSTRPTGRPAGATN